MTPRAGLAAVLGSSLALAASPAHPQQESDRRNQDRESRPALSEPLGCVSLEDVSPLGTPIDLFLASRECLEAGDAVKARDLLLLGGVRGRFDTGRVVDRTAWRAVIAAQRSIFGPLDEDKSEQLTDAMSKLEDHAAIITMCERMVALGAPEYFPAYMIDHGVEAAADRIGKEALDPDFKATEAWPRAVGDYFRCDEAQEKVNAGQAQ